jgi:hypothetical protein
MHLPSFPSPNSVLSNHISTLSAQLFAQQKQMAEVTRRYEELQKRVIVEKMLTHLMHRTFRSAEFREQKLEEISQNKRRDSGKFTDSSSTASSSSDFVLVHPSETNTYEMLTSPCKLCFFCLFFLALFYVSLSRFLTRVSCCFLRQWKTRL